MGLKRTDEFRKDAVRIGLTTSPQSFVALWGHSAVRAHGQT